MPRVTGRVKSFHEIGPDGNVRGTGYGFIVPDDGGPDVFVHRIDLGHSCPLKPGAGREVATLIVGQRVSFEVVHGDRGLKATLVELAE